MGDMTHPHRDPSGHGAKNGPGHPKARCPGPAAADGEPAADAHWQALWREAAEGAHQEGDDPLTPQEVAQLWSQLRAVAADEPAVPADLVPQVAQTLAQALSGPADPMVTAATGAAAWARPAPVGSAAFDLAVPCPGPRRPQLAQLAALVGAEARWLPLPFLVVQLLLAVGGLLLHLVALRFTGVETAAGASMGAAGAASGSSLNGWQLILASADSLALVAPWLGTVVALAAAWPRRRQLWADLEALSPFPPASRLLVRTGVAGVLATAVLLLAGWIQPAVVLAVLGSGLAPASPGPVAAGGLPVGGPPVAGAGGAALAPSVPAVWMAAAVVLARVAPLWLATAWALWWQVRSGTLAAMAASAALWAAITLGGRFLGPLNPLAAGSLPAASVHVAMLAGALLLAWHLRGSWHRVETVP